MQKNPMSGSYQSFEQFAHEHRGQADQYVQDAAVYIAEHVKGIPEATVTNVTKLTLRWLEKEHPEILSLVPEDRVREIVEEVCG